jgi:hypothetical protein
VKADGRLLLGVLLMPPLVLLALAILVRDLCAQRR